MIVGCAALVFGGGWREWAYSSKNAGFAMMGYLFGVC